MRRALTLAVLSTALSAACASSHSVADAGMDGTRDAAAPDHRATDGADGDAGGGPTCQAVCSVRPLITAVLERLGDHGHLEILAAASSGSSSLRLLLSRTGTLPGSIPRFEPVWYRVDVDLAAGSVGPVVGGSGLPLSIGEPDSPIAAFDDAVVDGAGSAVTLIRPTGETPRGARSVRAVYLSWIGDELRRNDLGAIVTLPEEPGLWDGSLVQLPDGNLLATIEYGGALHVARITRAAGSVPEIMSSAELGPAGEPGLGMAALSAGPAPDGHWALAGGGTAQGASRAAFAALAGPGGVVWMEPFGGSLSDPPPQVVGGADGAWAVRWEQNAADIQDTSVVVRPFDSSGLGPPLRVSTAPVPLPLQARLLRSEAVTYAFWNVRAPDDFSDGLVHVVLFGASDECPATQVQRLARLPGGTPEPASIYALTLDSKVLLLSLAALDDGHSELSALRVSCSVASGG